MNTKTKLALLCAASAIAMAPAAFAQQQAPAEAAETVVVTGSRVITDATMSPTPLTIVSTEALQATTPTDLPDALNKLPIFQGSTTPRGTNNASVNSAGNVLNLRNFGASRTLILMDGHRVAASNANGSVDVDALPQMLIQRVDVVTGGASAVYGSDAVTGVVNFILDKRFTGLKVEANTGISTYGDAASYNVGLAAGTDVFGSRGHVEVALRRFYQDGVNHNDRPEGPDYWLLTGAGTAASPFVNTRNARLTRYGSIITCAGCAANGMRFNETGGLAPYNVGTPSTTSGVSSGGDGGYSSIAQVTSSLGTNEAFGRFSYNLDDSTTFYVQASGAESYTKGSFQNHAFQTGTPGSSSGVPNTFLKSNPYMPVGDAAQFAGSTNYFTVSGYFDMGYPRSGYQSNGLQRSLHFTTGMDGTLLGDRYLWDVYFTHGEGRLHEDDPTNTNYQRMYAAMDAVPGSTAGSVVCYATTPAAGAAANAAYAGCVPINPFGANSVGMNHVTKQMNDYISGDTAWVMTNIVDNIGGSISGNIFDLPAGPVKAALSGEARWMGFEIQSNASPTATVDCTGLRTSVTGAPANILCNSATPLWQNNTLTSLPMVRESVWEFAGELGVPVVKNLPLVQSLDLDLAGRYTDYSTSGAVQTWKIGLDWHLSDDFRIRATNSIDIRAPTLNDLFAPVGQGIQSFTDSLHFATPITMQNYSVSQGNPNLVPEVARTYTAGVVFTPTFLPGFSASLDYYTITLNNAISSLSGGSLSIQKLCEDSGGTSPYCSLIVRPGPFSDRNPATNFPTQILSQPINSAFNKIEGFDLEFNYNFALADLMASLPGDLSIRGLASYQPVNESIQYTGAPLVYTAYPSGKFNAFIKYAVGNWSFNVQDRWISGFGRATQLGQIYAQPRVPSINYIDFNINKHFTVDDASLDGYISVQNLFDQRPHVNPTNSTNPGLYFMGVQGATTSLYDAIGRYFTIGVKARL